MAKNKISKNNSALSQRALLVSVNISQWVGRRVDKRATETANTAHKATAAAGNYNKKLLPNASELEVIATIASQARKHFYEQTLPWMTDGSRIISSQNYITFTASMRKYKSEFETAVKDFERAYPRLQKEAMKQLGDLYDKSEYPDPSEIASKFSLESTYLPLPDAKDFRVEISDGEKREFERKMKEVQAAAMRDCWDRLHGVVKAAAEKLGQPDAIFRDSLLENVTDIINLLPRLNVSDDAELEASRIEIQSLVAGLSSDTLRENKTERLKASKKLSDIETKMGAFMGGSKKKSFA